MSTPTPEHATSSGFPIAWGQPGASVAAGEYGDAGVQGAEGERLVAVALSRLPLGPQQFLFHDVVPPGPRAGNVDHVIVWGDTLVVIDAKRWAPGRYETSPAAIERHIWDQATGTARTVRTDAYTVARNGRPFEPGEARSLEILTEILVRHLRWRGKVVQVLAVSCITGDDNALDFARYQLPHCAVTTVAALSSTLHDVTGGADLGPQPDRYAAVVELARLTTEAQTLNSPYVALRDQRPAPPPIPAPPAVRDHPDALALGAAVAVTAVLFWLLPAMDRWNPTGWTQLVPSGLCALVAYRASTVHNEIDLHGSPFAVLDQLRLLLERVGVPHRRPLLDRLQKFGTVATVPLYAAVAGPVIVGVENTVTELPVVGWNDGLLHLLAALVVTAAAVGATGVAIMTWRAPHEFRQLWAHWGRHWDEFIADLERVSYGALPVVFAALATAPRGRIWLANITTTGSSSWQRDARAALGVRTPS